MNQACMKCGYTRAADRVPVAECPRCGAIYAKVAAAVAQGKRVHRVRTAGFGREAGPISGPMDEAAGGQASIPPPPEGEPMASPPTSPAAPRGPAPPSQRVGVLPPSDRRPFVKLLRSESLYPTFRAAVNVAFWLGVVLAVGCVIGGIVTVRSSETVRPLLIAIAVALGWMVLILLAREAALMIADLSDAAVRMAQGQEQRVIER